MKIEFKKMYDDHKSAGLDCSNKILCEYDESKKFKLLQAELNLAVVDGDQAYIHQVETEIKNLKPNEKYTIKAERNIDEEIQKNFNQVIKVEDVINGTAEIKEVSDDQYKDLSEAKATLTELQNEINELKKLKQAVEAEAKANEAKTQEVKPEVKEEPKKVEEVK